MLLIEKDGVEGVGREELPNTRQAFHGRHPVNGLMEAPGVYSQPVPTGRGSVWNS